MSELFFFSLYILFFECKLLFSLLLLLGSVEVCGAKVCDENDDSPGVLKAGL